jgi:arginyl-tRNA synthetase
VQTVSKVLTEVVLEACDRLGYGGVLQDVEPAIPTANAKFGDYQSNHAFRLAKAMGKNPRAVADEVVLAIPPHAAIAGKSVAGPGFLNFKLSDAWLATQLQALAADEHRGIEQTGRGRTAVVDFSSPNVAKRMHVGHMRSTFIGHAIFRLHQATGWHAISDNHIGDWGTQFGKLIVAYRRWLDREAYERDPIGELERLYVLFGAEKDKDAALEVIARAETAKLQSGDPENRALWQQFIAVSMAEFNQVYDRLGVRFDATLGESAYNDALAGTVEALLKEGIATESDGALVVRFGPEAGTALDGTVLVIRKQDGAYLYGTTDLATIEHRIATWRPERIVYVTDTRQQLHFRQVFAAWRQWRKEDRPDLVHCWFGMLKFGDSIMAARVGNIVRFVDLLDEAQRRARAVVDEKSGELTEMERASIAEAVGTSAVRYADLSQNPQSDVTFDWDRMLSLDGNTAPYLLYSYARCRSIQRKGAVTEPAIEGIDLAAPEERDLALHLVRFPEAVAAALTHQRPNLLCDHLFATANTLNRFYGACPVLSSEGAVRDSRLAIVEATARVLEHGLGVLGIPALSRM